MPNKCFTAAGCLLLLCLGQPPLLPAQGASDPEIDALDRKVRQFFEGVSADDAQAAFGQLLAGSQLAKQTEAFKALVDKTRELKTKYGDCRNYEQVAVKRIGKDVVVLKYLYQCEQFPVVWYVTFYRSPQRGDSAEEGNAWRVIILRFDTDLESLAK
jgi:hypothetical protein